FLSTHPPPTATSTLFLHDALPISPTASRARQPSVGTTTAAASTAPRYPIGHDDWISEATRPRWRAPKVSVTNAMPAPHSPPIPSPRRMRHSNICCQSCDVAAPRDAIEYTSTVKISTL